MIDGQLRLTNGTRVEIRPAPTSAKAGLRVMTLPELCIRRPVMTTLLMLAFVVFGMFSYRLLPVAAIPRVDFPTIVVNRRSFRAPAPRRWRPRSRRPLEQQFSTIAGLDSMISSSGQGITTITMQFDLDRNIDGAALDVQSALTSAAKRLPIQMTTPPSFIKVNPADFPVLFINLYSPTLPLSDVDEYAETHDRAAHLDLERRGAGAGLRAAEIRRPRPGQSRGARRQGP